MLNDYKTPEKSIQSNENLGSESTKSFRTNIFSNSIPKSHRFWFSERRYTSYNPNMLDQITSIPEDLEPETKSSKFFTFENLFPEKFSAHIHPNTENNRPNIDTYKIDTFTSDTSKVVSSCTQDSHKSSHLRNVSDADSVIYIAPDEKKNFFEGKNKNVIISSENSFDSLKRSLGFLDNFPCSVYCRFCKKEVHTSVEFYHSRVPNKILKVFASIFTCCNEPLWVNNFKVHKCPKCSLVLAKCR